jgi:hypothetical protein
MLNTIRCYLGESRFFSKVRYPQATPKQQESHIWGMHQRHQIC